MRQLKAPGAYPRVALISGRGYCRPPPERLLRIFFVRAHPPCCCRRSAVVRNDGGDRRSGGIKGGGERGKRGQSGVGDGRGKNAWRTRERRSAARSGGGRVNIVPRQEAVEEKRAGTAARGVSVGEVVRGSSAEEVGLAAASHMSVREGEHVERGCAAGVGARAAAGRGDSAAAEERCTTGPLSHAHAHPAPTCADLPVLAAVTSGATCARSHLCLSSHVPSLPSRFSRCLACPCRLPPPLPLYMMTCTSLCGAGAGLVPPCMRGAAGGTAFNAVAEELHEWTTAVAHVLPVSDDGGSTAEIVRVIGQPLTPCCSLPHRPSARWFYRCHITLVLLLPHHAGSTVATSRWFYCCHITLVLLLPHHAGSTVATSRWFYCCHITLVLLLPHHAGSPPPLPLPGSPRLHTSVPLRLQHL
ncbi:unnamed protein product [Closterium sp. NIES-54]